MTLTAPRSVARTPDFTIDLPRWRDLLYPGSLTQEHFSPRNRETIATLPACTPEEVAAAFEQARTAQYAWNKTPLKERAAIVSRFHDAVLAHHELLLDVVQHETGKSRSSAFDEVADIGLTAQYYAKSARRHLKPAKRQGAFPLLTRTREYYWPKGVVGMITPWNYPLTLPITDALPALLAGNAIVLKPDAQTPLSSLAAIDLLYQAGLPRGLFQVVLGDGPTVGGAIIDNADFVMFTGSTATGKKVAQACGERLIGFAAELGGKNPMIVLDDAPFDRALQGTIPASFSNSGQLCMAIERLYVHDAIYDRFVPALTELVSGLRLGTDLDYSSDVGSLISQEQLDKVTSHVNDAVARGAKVLTGGSPRPDVATFAFEPTLLENVSEDMELCRRETFGPVVAIYRFYSDDEAIALANDTRYGLNASVWGSPRRAEKIARAIEAGSVNVNEGFTASWASTDAPMGGFKESGVGRRHGREGIVKYTNVQTVATQRGMNVAAPKGMSPEKFAHTLIRGLRLMKNLPGRG
jgi:succinate-semialdehyde dehydrogenase/glutarate-semialdehyde dehydrogenase